MTTTDKIATMARTTRSSINVNDFLDFGIGWMASLPAGRQGRPRRGPVGTRSSINVNERKFLITNFRFLKVNFAEFGSFIGY